MDISKLSEYAAMGGAPVHAGRVLQLDGDFPCYFAADIEKSLQQNFKSFCDMIKNYTELVGAEHCNVFVTLGLKSGRVEMATVQGYQEKRDDNRDPLIKERVHAIRRLVAEHDGSLFEPRAEYFREADDAMVTEHVAHTKKYGMKTSVVMSGDKDLWMIEGYFADPKTGKMDFTTGYGHTEYRDVGNVKPKLVGRGTSWFWHQMIMGDAVDNIKGLPFLTPLLANRYVPTKKYNPNRKPLAAGEAKAVAMLKTVRTDQEAAHRVYEAYIEWYKADGVAMFIESAYLLWMQRTDSPHDVLEFLGSLGLPNTFTTAQETALNKYDVMKEIQLRALSNSN